VKRIVGVLALVAVLVGLVAGPVAARATTLHEQYEGTIEPFYTFNPCNNDERVYVTGHYSGVYQEVQTPSGQVIWTSNGQITGTGEGDLGNHYVYNEAVTQHVTYSPPNGSPNTITHPVQLISQGSDDNFVFTTYWRVTGNGELEFIGVSGPECRG
jgi:hypothetical protein